MTPSREQNELLPCPFCGAPAQNFTPNMIHCSVRDCVLGGYTIERAKWQQRTRLSSPSEGFVVVPKDTVAVVRMIHETVKRGKETEDHGIVGNLRCILDHVTPDPFTPSRSEVPATKAEKATDGLSCY